MADAFPDQPAIPSTRAETACVGGELTIANVKCGARWQIKGCPVSGVAEFDSLVGAIRNRRHGINIRDFERRLRLGVLWEWSDIEFRISEGLLTAERLDQAIHEGLTSRALASDCIALPGIP